MVVPLSRELPRTLEFTAVIILHGYADYNARVKCTRRNIVLGSPKNIQDGKKERKKEKALDRYHAETYHWAESVAVVPSPSTPILCCSSGSNQLSSTVAFTLLMYSFIFSRYS